VCYQASWQLSGPDSHRQATTSLRTLGHLHEVKSSSAGRTNHPGSCLPVQRQGEELESSRRWSRLRGTLMEQQDAAAIANHLFDANLFDLTAPIRINYSSSSIRGVPLVSYKDADLDLNFQ